MKFRIFLVIVLSVKNAICLAQIDTIGARGLKPVNISKTDTSYNSFYKNSYALIIGVSDYQNKWSKLPGAANDADSIEKALKKHGFITTIVKNPGLPSVLQDSLIRFLERADDNKDNRVIIYYAGHGYVDETGSYLVMSRGEAPFSTEWGVSSEDRGRTAENSSYYDIRRLFELFRKYNHCKHLLLVLDGCFLGKASNLTIQAINLYNDMPPMIKEYLTTPGRYLLTASTSEQSVPDKSIFCEYLIKGINGEADLFKDGYITLSELKIYLQNNIGNVSGGRQIIFLGQILDEAQMSKLDKAYGELIFFVPGL